VIEDQLRVVGYQSLPVANEISEPVLFEQKVQFRVVFAPIAYLWQVNVEILLGHLVELERLLRAFVDESLNPQILTNPAPKHFSKGVFTLMFDNG
jgi:hypothetical protein